MSYWFHFMSGIDADLNAGCALQSNNSPQHYRLPSNRHLQQLHDTHTMQTRDLDKFKDSSTVPTLTDNR